MSVSRGQSQSWEMRLGALQMVIWLGLAVGAMVGAYFVGFFSGRYVGFETARSASGVEVAKLAITDDVPGQGTEGVSAIYNKLNSSETADIQAGSGERAGLATKPRGNDSSKGPGSNRANDSRAGGSPEPEGAGARMAQEIKSGGPVVARAPGGDKHGQPSEGAAAASEIDAIFDTAADTSHATDSPEFGSDADRLPDERSKIALERSGKVGDFDPAADPTLQKGVRVLGGAPSADNGSPDSRAAGNGAEPHGRGDTRDDQVAAAEGNATDKTLGAILEERVAKARAGEESRVALAGQPSLSAKEAAVSAKEEKAKAAAAKAASASQAKEGSATVVVKEAVKPTAAPVATSPAKPSSDANMVKQVLPAGFFAQVAAPKRIGEAQDVARRLKRSGFPVVIETAHVRGEDYYRVLVGPEENKVQADRLVDQLKRESYLSGSAFLRQVK